MYDTLYELLHQCTVRLMDTSSRNEQGTGFFVAPGLILTCAHVARKAYLHPQNLEISWNAQTHLAQKIDCFEETDLALVQITSFSDHPCVLLDEALVPADPLYSYGYPAKHRDGDSATFGAEGWTQVGKETLLKFKSGQVEPGMSGAPLLNERTRRVCGMIALTRDRSADLGGRAIWTRTIWQVIPALRWQQDQFHLADQQWLTRLKAVQDVYDMFFVREEITIIAPQVKVVISQDDPAIDDFFVLYESLFPNLMERASVHDMKRYVQESQEEKAKLEPEYLEELVLVMNQGKVMAFINYTFYIDTGFVLVSYIGLRKPLKTQLKQAVMSALINHFKETMLSNDCLGVVFEAENTRDKHELEPSRIRVFRRYLKEYADMKDVHCYRVEFNFIQPLLMIEDVIERTKGSRGLLGRFIRRNHSSAQSLQNLGIVDLLSLGFIPLKSGFVSGKMISKEKLMSILQFVYREVYGDSFIENLEEDKIYKDYMEELLRYYEKTLPKEIAVSERA